jgi:type I restriction-modification system DNA methylase subunit
MNEELLQRNLIECPEKIGTWDFYNIGSTSINTLKQAGIIKSLDYGNIGLKKVDAIIVKQKEVIAIVENKQPKEFNTKSKKHKAISQEIEVAKKLKAKLIIATDTYETLWVNVATGNFVQGENGNDFKYIFDPKDTNLQKIITEIIQSINNKNDKILPKELIDPTGLAKQIWQDVWSASGAPPENCLYTFIELFVFKYLSDLNILQGMYSFTDLFKMYDENDPSAVLQYYANTIRPKIKELFPENHIDKTTIINGSLFISKEQKAVNGYDTTFKQVLERFKNYGKLEHIDHDFKSKLFECFLKESISKKNWGQFFTPIKVVRAIVEMAKSELKEGMTVCDPACGVGKFPLEFIKGKLDKLFTINNNKISQKVKIIGFDKGFDKDEQKTIILAKANMLIYFCELVKDNIGLTKEFAQIFNDSFILKTNSILGTLSEPIENEYDLILTNPPYVTSGSSNLKKEIAQNSILKKHYKINAMGVEGLFMEWIIKALKPDGKAFVIVPDGIFNRQYSKNLRQYILDTCYIDAIISLPIKTFFTTSTKTYVFVITKKNDISEIQNDPVFSYLVSEIGESRDVNRFDIEQNDLEKAVVLFNQFKGAKSHFKTNDERCKILPIKTFSNNINNNWIIDKEWTDEEKIKLEIHEEEKLLNINDYSDLVGKTSLTLSKFSKLLKKEVIVKKIRNDNKEITINEIFTIQKGLPKYTKKYMDKYKGDYPVYSSQTTNEGIISSIDTYDYDSECLTWTTDGTYVGTVFFRNGKFSMTTHCGALFLKKEFNNKIYLSYMLYVLNQILPLYKKGENSNKRLGVSTIQQIKVIIPINLQNEFDFEKQREIAKKYCAIEKIKNNIRLELKRIESVRIDIEL